MELQSYRGRVFWGNPLDSPVREGGLILGADRWAWERSPRASPSWRMPWPPADNHHGGHRGQEAILVQNTQIKQSKQGLAVISGRPSKPVTHQGSGCSGNRSWFAAGHTAQTESSCLPVHPPPKAAGRGRVSGVLREWCRHGGAAGVELEGTGASGVENQGWEVPAHMQQLIYSLVLL